MQLFVVIGFVLGLAIGSFLNVVVYRVPNHRSLVSPRSACPHCSAPIRPRDNIPVFSWLLLRAKCRNCGAPISVRYPLVELGTAITFAVVTACFLPAILEATSGLAVAAGVIRLLAYLYLGAVSIALALIDLDVHRLPNVIVLPAYIIGTASVVSSALLTARPDDIVRPAIGLGGLFLFYLLMSLLYRGGMGMGDVKLAGVLGLFLAWQGWGSLAVGAFAPFLIGGVFGVILVALRKAGRKTKIPFGPWMLLGAWVGIFGGDAIFGGYLRLVGLA